MVQNTNIQKRQIINNSPLAVILPVDIAKTRLIIFQL